MSNQPPTVVDMPSSSVQKNAEQKQPASKEGKTRYAQEKVMLALMFVFFLGVVALTIVPPPFAGAAMGLIIFLTLIAMFRFN